MAIDLSNYVPAYLMIPGEAPSRHVVTAQEWNELWLLSVIQNNHTSEALHTLIARLSQDLPGNSGAGFIKASTIEGIAGITVQEILQSLKDYIDNQVIVASTGNILDNSITNNKLATNIKIGNLSSLNTGSKANVVASINEVNQNVNTLANIINAVGLDYTSQIPYGGVTTNSGNNYIISQPELSNLVAGVAVSFKINTVSTGAVTLNWNNTGAKSVKTPTGADVVFFKDGIYTVRYNGVNYILQSANDDDTALTTHESKTDTAHGIGTKMPKSGGTFTGQVKAQNNTAYTTAQVRNIILWDGSGAKPATNNGDILITYTP